MYKIYSLKKYSDNDKNLKPTSKSNNVLDIVKELENNNNGYHLKLSDDINYKIYFDLDHLPNNYYIYSIISCLASMFNIDEEDIKYTESIKTTSEFSYHIVIPKLGGDLKTIKHLVSKLKKEDNILYYDEDETIILNKYFDDSVYKINQLFRLPNQTNNDKKQTHIIKNGSLSDFILNYTDETKEFLTISDEEQPKNKNKNKKYKKEIEIKKSTYLTDEQIIKLLNHLDDSYLDDYNSWSIITNILKGIDKFKIWDDWSKQSDKYNRFKNLNIWKNTKKIKFSINYLISISDCKDEFYKKYEPLTIRQPDIKFNNKYVSSNTDDVDFEKYKTIIIQSTTGTGKTTAISKKLKKLNNIKILSIVSRITLGDQIINSFNKEKIKMDDYRTTKYSGQNFNVCINSLLKLDIDDEILENTVVYIDEINSFIKHLMMLQGVDVKSIFSLLMHIIKNCKLLILSDAIISDSIFILIKNREDNIYFIENTFKKFENIKATQILDEVLFKNKIEEKIKTNQYGLFGFDSKTVVTSFYDDFISKYPDKIDNIILITSDKPFSITNASEQFKNKFVFFSPSITTAVDFSIPEAQDVFIYIKGNTIDSSEVFQQATRTRNIKELFFYCDKSICEEQFENLNDCIHQYKTLSKTAELLNDVCSYINNDDELEICNNTFFKLFVYIQYVNDIYNINKLKHFKLILEENKFILDEEGIKNILYKKELIDASKEIQVEELNNFLNDPTNPKYEIFVKRIEILNLPLEKDVINKYSHLILDPFKLDDYLNSIRFFKDDKYINKKIEQIKYTNYSVKWMNNIYNKIHLFRQFETKYKIDFEYDNKNNEPFELPKDEINLYNKIFRITFKPKTKGDLLKIYISMIKHIMGADSIKTVKKQINKVRKNIYSFNDTFISELLEINKFQNPDKLGFNIVYNKILNIPDREEEIKEILDTSKLDVFVE